MSKPDESDLERDYCAGQLSLRDMEKIHGISEGAIRKRAKKNGWVRKEKSGTQKGTQVRKSGTQKKQCVPRQSPQRLPIVARRKRTQGERVTANRWEIRNRYAVRVLTRR